MRTGTYNPARIVEAFYRLSKAEQDRIMNTIHLPDKKKDVSVISKQSKKSPYNSEFVKMIQERKKGEFISMQEYQELWK